MIKNLALSTIAAGFEVPENGFSRYFELAYLRRLLRVLDINCVLDVGVNRGQFADELKRTGYRGPLFLRAHRKGIRRLPQRISE